MNWLSDFVRPKIKKITTKEIADNLWTKCPQCGQMLFTKELEKTISFALPATIICVCR